jgi:hypothetical protein
VTAETQITLTKETGSGTLGGTLVGIIANGSNTVVFDNVVYESPEAGVSIKASATGGMTLAPGISEPFEVLALPENIIAQWTFDDTIEPALGLGSASLIGGVTQHSATIGNGWRITNLPRSVCWLRNRRR